MRVDSLTSNVSRHGIAQHALNRPTDPVAPPLRVLARQALASLALVAVLALGAALLPHLSSLGAVALAVAFGVLAALPDLTGAAIRRGHALIPLIEGRPLRRLLGGASLRLLIGLTLGTVGASLLLIRLVEGGAATWMLALGAVAATMVAAPVVHRRFSQDMPDPHAGYHSRIWTRRVICLLVLAGYGALGALGHLPRVPDAAPAAASALVTEALEWNWIAVALTDYALGAGPALLGLGAVPAAVIALLWHGMFIWTVGSIAVAATMSANDLFRAVAPASVAGTPPPADRLALALVVGWLGAVAVGAAAIDRMLERTPPEARPSGYALQYVELIDGETYMPGTAEGDARGVEEALRDHPDQTQALRVALEAGFDQMQVGVDPFLDGYYSVWGDYMRLIHLVWGDLDAHLEAQLSEALGDGDPFAEYEALRTRLIAAQAELEAARAEYLDARRVDPSHPALLRPVSSLPPLPPLPMLPGLGMLTRVEHRAAVSAGTGVVSTVIAGRVAERLAQRGALRVAARVLSRALGLIVVVGVDVALVRLEEHFHRDDFRDEILAEINALRVAALAALEDDEEP
jgi:hypothetical protein